MPVPALGVTAAAYTNWPTSPFATLVTVDGAYRFYTADLTTGRVFSLGRFDEAVADIAIPLNQ
jgi:hypothetical protein